MSKTDRRPRAEEKARVRRTLIERRARLDPESAQQFSAGAAQLLSANPAWANANPVALFRAMPGEADPAALADLAPGPVAYPRVEGGEIVFRCAPTSELSPVPPFGIYEPGPEHPIIESFGLIVVPGVGFTLGGDRLGYGRGFYDRALRAARRRRPDVLTVGFTFSLQIVDELPTDDLDERLDAIVSEQGWVWTGDRRGTD